MEKNLRNRTLALAALMQSARLVDRLAHEGAAEAAPLEALLGSILKVDSETLEDVYGGVQGLETGLRQLVSHLDTDQRPRDLVITRYVIALLVLEKKLSRRADLQATIRRGVEACARQHRHFGLLHENLVAALAELYLDTISTLTPRIMVKGEPERLANPDIANRIRATLLAGIRAAVLWRQAGGSRWQLLLWRGRFVAQARQLLDEAGAPPAA